MGLFLFRATPRVPVVKLRACRGHVDTVQTQARRGQATNKDVHLMSSVLLIDCLVERERAP